MTDKIKVDLEVEEREALKSIEKFIKKMKKAETGAEDLEEGVEDVGKSVKKTFSQNLGLDKVNKSLKEMRKGFFDLSGAADVFKGVALANIATRAFEMLTEAVGAAVEEFLDFEKAVVGVQKTTGITGKRLDKFVKSIQQLSKEIPVSQNELLELSEAAGQLGVVGEKNLLKFTETMAKMSVATDVVGDEGAKSIVRILTVLDEGVGDVDKFGAALVALGNSSAATESEILHVANEVSRAVSVFGVSSDAVLGMSTALKSLGVRAELGGTVMGKAFRQIGSIIEGGGDKFESFTKVLKINGDTIKKAYKEDATEAFKIFVKSLGDVEGGAIAVTNVLESMGLRGEGVAKVLPALAKNYDLLDEKLKTANKGAEENNALNDEAEAAYDTLGSALTRFGNIAKVLATNALDPLAESTKNALDSVNDFLDGINTEDEITDRLKEIKQEIEGIDELLEAKENRPLTLSGAELATTNESLIKQKEYLIDIRNELTKTRRESEEGSLLLRPQENVDPITPTIDTEKITQLEFEAAEERKEIMSRLTAAMAEEEKTRSDNTAEAIAARAELAKIQEELVAQEQEAKAAIEKEKRDAAANEELEFQERLALVKRENVLKEKQALSVLNEKEKKELRDIQIQKLELEKKYRLDKAKLITDDNKKALAIQKIQRDSTIAIAKKESEQRIAIEKEKQKVLAAQLKNGADLASATAGFVSAMSGKETRASFLLEKAAAAARIIVSGQVAAAQALAVPPAPNFFLSGVAKATTALNLATVAATSIKGFAEGGFVQGSSFSGDSQIVRVNSGEFIANQSQQKNILEAVANGGANGGSETVMAIKELTNAMATQPIVVQIGEEEFARAARNAQTDGFL